MNITPRVKLATQKKSLAHPSRIPLHRALRWVPKEEEMSSVKPPLDIFLTQNAFVRMCAHAGSDLDNEIGGWMAGKFCRDSLHGTPFGRAQGRGLRRDRAVRLDDLRRARRERGGRRWW